MDTRSGPQDARRAVGPEQRSDHAEAHGHAVGQRRYHHQHNIFTFVHTQLPAEVLTLHAPSPDLPLGKGRRAAPPALAAPSRRQTAQPQNNCVRQRAPRLPQAGVVAACNCRGLGRGRSGAAGRVPATGGPPGWGGGDGHWERCCGAAPHPSWVVSTPQTPHAPCLQYVMYIVLFGLARWPRTPELHP